ncbi:MAG: hypothetical protein AAF763_03705 [Pseudomonadota bacterium]
MTILTGVVLTIALGAVAQRGDLFGDFGMATAYVPRDDVVTVSTEGAYLIDVTANDEGAQPGDGNRILITEAPRCGVVYRHQGAIAFEGAGACGGTQRMSYCVASGDDCREAEVTLILNASAAALGSASGTPVRKFAGDEGVRTAAVGAGEASGFTVEDGAATRPLAAVSSPLGSLAPSDAGVSAAAPTE